MSKYVPYHKESVEKAKELVKNEKNQLSNFITITNWITRTIRYDYVRALKMPRYGKEFPDVDGCWKKGMGICMDVSSMTVGMLRAVGVQAYMCYGHTEKSYHAWVEATINGKTYRYDHSGKAKKYRREKIFR